jgi:hypothetical protein
MGRLGQREQGADTLDTEQHIGWAVYAMESGRKVRRRGWNGAGMWLELVYNHMRPTDPHYALLHTASGQTVPWTCSQTDLFARDWEEAL